MPRLLGEQDRNPLSPRAGLFGRAHWAWKALPMPDPTSQYAIALLARLWAAAAPDNPYHRAGELLDSVALGLGRLRRLQRRDGSFDQVFPNERSYGATAYLAGAVLDVLAATGSALPAPAQADAAAILDAALPLLVAGDERYGEIANHLALFAWTCDRLAARTGDRRLHAKAAAHLDRLLAHGSPEGWFREYDGADPGYQTQCLHYLTLLADAGWSQLEAPIAHAIDAFLALCAHPDGSLGGHYGSRTTALVYPAGLARRADTHPTASAILAGLIKGVDRGTVALPADLDLPNLVRLGANYLEAWMRLETAPALPPGRLPWQEVGFWRALPGAGLAAATGDGYYAVVGGHQGGVVLVFDTAARRLVFEDRGYAGRLNGKTVTTHRQHPGGFRVGARTLCVDRPFFVAAMPAMTPIKHAVLAVVGVTVLWVPLVREAVKRVLVDLLITGRRTASAHMVRDLRFETDRVIVRDRLFCRAGLAALTASRHLAAVHMASANYHSPAPAATVPDLPVAAVPGGEAGVVIETTITVAPAAGAAGVTRRLCGRDDAVAPA